jgi:hypothetical protein
MFASSELDAFVFGLKFTEEGVASLLATPTLYIPPGDHNLNGLVNAADYVIARKNGSSEQYDIWRAHFGEPSGTGSFAANSIPEPSHLILLAVGVTGLAGCRGFFAPGRNRRRRRLPQIGELIR